MAAVSCSSLQLELETIETYPETTETLKDPKPILSLKTRLYLAGFHFGLDASRSSDCKVNRQIFSLIDFQIPAPCTKTVDGISVRSSDITVNSENDLWFRMFVPEVEREKKLPIVFYIHGGGFTFFSPSSKPYDDLCRILAAKLPAVVVSVNYRQSPQHRYPCQHDDVYEIFNFIDSKNHSVLPSCADLTKCFVAGDSAGGNIGHHISLKACQNPKTIKIAGLFLIQPFFGGEERTKSELRLAKAPSLNLERSDWYWKAFLPEGCDRNHKAVNVFGSSSDSVPENVWRDMFPATMVVVGGFDLLQDWQKRYYQDLKLKTKEGKVKMVEYPNAIHGFYGFPEIRENDFLIRDFKLFVQTHTSY
jgi:acetyl esterase/lipase